MAELKQHRLTPTRPAPSVTHGVTAVAELKLDGERELRRDKAVTHGVTAVAELKLRCGYITIYRPCVTHGVTAVAELKPCGAGGQRLGLHGHPRRHRRGRIEAWPPPTS